MSKTPEQLEADAAAAKLALAKSDLEQLQAAWALLDDPAIREFNAKLQAAAERISRANLGRTAIDSLTTCLTVVLENTEATVELAMRDAEIVTRRAEREAR